jgi:hypothetical protein
MNFKSYENNRKRKGELFRTRVFSKISKIIVHHTASTANLIIQKALRSHTLAYEGRGWGDIDTTIFRSVWKYLEGRAGGEMVVAHAGRANTDQLEFQSWEITDR